MAKLDARLRIEVPPALDFELERFGQALAAAGIAATLSVRPWGRRGARRATLEATLPVAGQRAVFRAFLAGWLAREPY